MKTTIACLGAVVVDILMKPIDNYPSLNGLITVEQVHWQTGGCAMNTAINLAKFNREVSLFGAIAEDPLGRWIEKECCGIGLSAHFQKEDNIATSMTIVCISESGNRSFIHHPGANARLWPQGETVAEIAFADYLYVGGVYGMSRIDSNLGLLLYDIKKKNPHIIIFLDVIYKENIRNSCLIDSAFPFVDFFLPNINEAISLSGERHLPDIGAYFASKGLKRLIVTMGRKGAFVYQNQKGHFIPAFNVSAWDTTGAGDAFSAALIAAIDSGMSLEKSLQLATGAGALCVGKIGATTGIRDFSQLQSFVDAQNNVTDGLTVIRSNV